MKLTKEELASLSPDERAALTGEEVEQSLAMIGDTKLEPKPAPAPAAPTEEELAAQDAAAETAAEGADSEGGTTDAAAPAPAAAAPAEPAAIEEPAAPVPAPAPAPFKVDATDYTEQRKTLATEKAGAFKKWSDGQLSDDEYATAQAQFDDRLADLVRAQTRADTLREANEQRAAQERAAIEQAEHTAMANLAQSVKDTVDYSDATAARQFDLAFDAVKADPKNAALTPAQQVAKAHGAVLAMRGIAAPAPTAAAPSAPAAPAAKPKPRDVPTTLGGLPNAAPAGVHDDLMEQAGRLSGLELEEFLARQTPSTVARIMRTADNSGIVH